MAAAYFDLGDIADKMLSTPDLIDFISFSILSKLDLTFGIFIPHLSNFLLYLGIFLLQLFNINRMFANSSLMKAIIAFMNTAKSKLKRMKK